MHCVPSTCLERLTPQDFLFIESTLTGAPPGENRLQSLFENPNTLHNILEQDSLFRALVETPFPTGVSPELYFYVLVRRSLREAGIEEIAIADYVASTLALHALGRHPVRSLPNRPELDFTYQVDFLEAIEGLSEYDRFFLQVHCANQFLVLTGLFPRFLESRASRRGVPGIHYYEGVARQAFLTAGKHPLADEFALRSLYPQLAGCLHETRRALNRMAENYLFLGS